MRIEWRAAMAVLLLFAFWTSGCTTKPRQAPVIERQSDSRRVDAQKRVRSPDWRPAEYQVKRGDTLYSIALEHGLDYRELAEWNRLENPHHILAGQTLSLRSRLPQPPESPVARPLPVEPVEGHKPSTTPATADEDENVEWIWPAAGRILAGFVENSGNKGLDLAGQSGETVAASAAGRVVYSGQGLRGYGKLIIIKHNKTYLSAYAHNSQILVREGQVVAKGQKIAEMGSSDTDRVKLHFEIRRFGRPVDPLKYLPGDRPS